MSDIIEHLRDEAVKVSIERASGKTVSSRDTTGSVIWKAASEIERLQQVIERSIQIAESYETCDMTFATRVAARDIADRIRALASAGASPAPQTNGRASGAGKMTPDMLRDTAGWSQSEDDLRETLRCAADELERALAAAPAPELHVRASILEEAAKIADEEAAMWGHTDGSSARVVAQRIRALASEGQADA